MPKHMGDNSLAYLIRLIKGGLSAKGDDLTIQDNRLYLSSGSSTIGEGVILPSGGGGVTGSVLTITNNMSGTAFTVLESAETANISYNVTSLDSDTDQPTGNIITSWYTSVDGVDFTRVYTSSVSQGDNTFNVRPYLRGATTYFKLTCSDTYGQVKSLIWTVTATDYAITWNLTDEISYHGDGGISVRMVPYGLGEKTIYLSVDDTVVYSLLTEANNNTITTTLDALSHGAHTIKLWLEVDLDGNTIETEALHHVGIWSEEGVTTPIVAVFNSTASVRQYGTVGLDYFVFDPLNPIAEISLKKTGDVISTLSVDRSIHTWAYKSNEVGTDYLSIQCGSTVGDITVTVESLGYNIEQVTNGLILDLDPSGHSNNDADYNLFGWTDANGDNHPLTFSEGFDWINGGFQLDDDGVTALVVKRGDRVTINTADVTMFSGDTPTNGREIKLVFKSTNVRDFDAEIMSCVTRSNGSVISPGFTVGAQTAMLYSALTQTDIQYCEGSKIEMDINIESIMGNAPIDGSNQIATVWLEGIPSRCFSYSNSDSWTQINPQPLVIGSDEADVWIYRIKLYGNSLTRRDVLTNYIADCADTEEMVDRYERNDIFAGSGAIDIEKLHITSPKLRTIEITAQRMTTGKKDGVNCDVKLVYPHGGDTMSFTARDATMYAQGTSSMAYGQAAYNLDIDFSTCSSWVDDDGNPLSGYAMTDNSIPCTYFNIKANVASSENANNVILADEYNLYQPNITAVRDDNPKVRDTIEGHPCAVFFKNSSGSTINVGARTLASGDTMLYFCGDMNNSKKNYAVFGQDNSLYGSLCCVEVSNNNNNPCRFKSEVPATETWDGDELTSNFEFRYPKKPSDTDKQRWVDLVAWVVSTDRSAATNDPLASPVVISGVTYTNDTTDYRAAKFKNEVADYFSVDSLTYHYLFTERHCMVDNRAKNTFYSYEPDINGNYRWNLNKNYDDDTAEGANNEGEMVLTFGLEDTDYIGNRAVFNAADNVLWCNVRDLLSSELIAMFQRCETAGAWDAERILNKFLEYQNTKPEALTAEDMYQKYYMASFSPTTDIDYLAKMLGTKADQRRQFEIYQEKYMSAKYRSVLAYNDQIKTRTTTQIPDWSGVEPTGDVIGVVPYANTYLWVKYGEAGYVSLRAYKGQSYDIICPADSLNDTETYICNASMISEIGSLAALYSDYMGVTSARRLMNLKVGSGATGYENANFTASQTAFSNNAFIEVIDFRGLPNYDGDMDCTQLTALREIRTTGSNATSVTFANGAPVETAQLNPLRKLVARNLSRLESFSMSADNLQQLFVENCPEIDTLSLCEDATGLVRIRLIGIDWNVADHTVFDDLKLLAGLDENARESASPVLRGRAYFTAPISISALSDHIDDWSEVDFSVSSFTDSVFLADSEALVGSDGKIITRATNNTSTYTPEQINEFLMQTLYFMGDDN